MRVLYSKPATMEYEAPRALYLDGRMFVPCNAASALWPFGEMNCAYCYESARYRFEVRPAAAHSPFLIPSRFLGVKP